MLRDMSPREGITPGGTYKDTLANIIKPVILYFINCQMGLFEICKCRMSLIGHLRCTSGFQISVIQSVICNGRR
jgi:hypothetical protein